MKGYYQSVADDEAQRDERLYRAIEPDGSTDSYRLEPKRSRMQVDISKASRLTIGRLAKDHHMNTKELVVYALAQTFPEIAEVLELEVRLKGNMNRQNIEGDGK